MLIGSISVGFVSRLFSSVFFFFSPLEEKGGGFEDVGMGYCCVVIILFKYASLYLGNIHLLLFFVPQLFCGS